MVHLFIPFSVHDSANTSTAQQTPDNATTQSAANTSTTQQTVDSSTINIIRNYVQNIPREETANNTSKEIKLLPGVENRGLKFTLIQAPQHGNLTGINENDNTIPGTIIYTPNKDFVGLDFFIFNVTAGNEHIPGTQYINISVPTPLNSFDPYLRIILGSVIALIIMLIIFYSAKTIIEKKKFYPGDVRRIRFIDIIRGQDMDPSLSIFQFMLWTGVIIFAFTAVYFIRILGGVYYPPAHGIPVFLLALMGISVGVPLVSNVISAYKYSPKQVEFRKESPPAESDQEKAGGNTNIASAMIKPLPKLSEMLNEYGKPSLGRFQMFAWTWISIIIYLFVFFSAVFANANNPSTLELPDIDPTLVVLMGLSQFAFLGIKAITEEMQITKVWPLQGATGDYFSIYGNNFGKDGQIVWIGAKRIPLPENDKESTINWSSDRIDIKIPDYIPPGEHEIRVAKGGSWIKANEKLKVIGQQQQQPPNNSSKAKDQDIPAEQNKPKEIILAVEPTDNASGLTFSKVTEPSNGKADIVDPSKGKVTYTPNKDYSGADSFQFKVSDGKSDSNIVTVKITVTKINAP